MAKVTFPLVIWITLGIPLIASQSVGLNAKLDLRRYLQSTVKVNQVRSHLTIKPPMGQTSEQEPFSSSYMFVKERRRRATKGMAAQDKMTFDLGTAGCSNFACSSDKAAKKPPTRVTLPPLETKTAETSSDSSKSRILSELLKRVNVLKKLKGKLKLF